MPIRRNSGLAIGLAAIAVVALSLSACSADATPATTATDVALPAGVEQSVIIGGSAPGNLDPGAVTGFTGPSEAIVQNVFGLLLAPTDTLGQYTPDLATDWKFNDDYTQLTLTLRADQTFTDGTPFDAAAVKFNYDRYLSATSRASQYLTTLASVKAVDDVTVQFNFKLPTANFLDVLARTAAGAIGSPTAIKNSGDKYGLNIVGAGPFMQSNFVPTTELDLVPNPGYWNASKVYLQKLEYLGTGTDPQATYQQLVSGAIDLFQVNGATSSPSVLNDATANSSIKVTNTDDNQYLFLPLNITTPPFDNLQARKAIDYCTDRVTLAKTVTQGWGNPAWIDGGADTLYYPDGGADAYAKNFPYPFDAAKGTAIVKQLGGLSFEIWNMGGQYAVVTNALAQMWKQNCGIEASANSETPAAFTTRTDSGNYQAVLTISGGLNDPIFFRTFQTDTAMGKSVGGTGHPEITGQIDKAQETTDPAELTAIWAEFWKQVNTQALSIPVVSGSIYYIQNPCLQDLVSFTSGGYYGHAYLNC